MQDYLLDYDDIKPRWEKCEKEIERNARYALEVQRVQFACHHRRREPSTALSGLGYLYIEITPLICENGKWVSKKDLYDNEGIIQKISEVVNVSASNHDFQYEGVIIDDSIGPLFIVKLGE